MPNRDLRVGGVEPELITTVLRFGTICCAALAVELVSSSGKEATSGIGGALERIYSARSGRGTDLRPQDHPPQFGQELRPKDAPAGLPGPSLGSARDSPKSTSGRILTLITAPSAARVEPV